MNDRTVKKLLVEIGNNSVGALEQLYIRTKNFVYAYALSITRNPAVAEDAMQEVYVKIMKYASSFDEKCEGATAYLIGIIKNCCYEQLKRANETEQLDEELPWSDDGEESERLEAQAELNLALSKISDEEKTVVLMHEVGGYTFREIGKYLSKPKSSVADIHKAAMKKLKEYLT